MKRILTIGAALGLLAGLPPAWAQTADTDQAMPVPEFLSAEFTEQQIARKWLQRFLHNYRMRANADGALPASPGSTVAPAISTLAASTTLSYVLNSRWTSLGPQPITGGQVGNQLTTRPMSGRVSSIAVHPTNPNRWLVGAANGGVWETKDGGANFVALTDGAPTLSIGAVTYAPSNGNVIYVGTGEATFSGVSFGGEGVLKSIDGGVNWRQMAAGTFVKGTAFSAILVDPANPDVLVAATSRGVFGRPSASAPAVGAVGLWRSVDGGSTWTQTLPLDGTWLAAKPDDFSRMYAGIGRDASAAAAVQRSTDGGATWTPVPGPWSSIAGGNTNRTFIAFAPSNPNRAYVTMSNRATQGVHGLWTTTNAWDASPTWVAIPLGPTDNGSGTLGPCGFDKAFNSPSAQCFYNMVLTVKPTDENILFYGGIPVWRLNLSTNTWVEVSQTAAPANRNNGIHVDQHAAAWAGARLIMGNDGGVWSTTTDGDGAWSAHNATLVTAQYYEGSALPDGSSILAGSQDNGTHRRTTNNAWPLVSGGDGAGNLSSTAGNHAVSSQNQNVFRTTGNFATLTNVRGNYGGNAPFIGKMRECDAAPGTVILNGSRVNRTTNFYGGAATSLWTNGFAIFTPATAGSAIEFGVNCDIIGAGHSNGEIRITAVGDITAAGMIERDPGNQVPNRPVSSFAFDPGSATKVCVGLTGFSGGAPANIFCTANFTAPVPTWTNVSLPVDIPVNALKYDPSVPNRLYAGGDFGVWVSPDAGASWQVWGPGAGMPNVPVFDLVARGGRLYAFTHGRGAFMLSNFDIDGDSAVGCADVAIVKAAYGKKIGDVGYDPAADLNGDNVVNIRDLTMIARQLPGGTTCP